MERPVFEWNKPAYPGFFRNELSNRPEQIDATRVSSPGFKVCKILFLQIIVA